MNYGGYQDQTDQRVQRALGIPMGDGRVFQNGAIVSAADAANADATRQRNAQLDAQARGQAIQGGGTDGQRAGWPAVPGSQVAGPPASGLPSTGPVGPYDPASPSRQPTNGSPGFVPGVGVDVSGYSGSRYAPDYAQNNPQPAAPNPQSQFIRQQLLAMNGTQPDRIYTPATLARASDAQVAGELAAQKPRNEFLNDQLKRMGETTAAGAGYGSYDDAVASLPAGVTGDISQDAKTGRWLTTKATPTKPEAGFPDAESARASIPAGSKGQVSMTAGGRYVVQYGVNDAPPAPESPIGKMQQDLALAVKQGRTDDAAALKAKIAAETSTTDKPFTVRDFQMQPDLMKQYGMSYGKYLADYNRMKAEAGGTGAGGAAANQSAAPVAVKSKAERDALQPGTRYVGPDGKTYRKP